MKCINPIHMGNTTYNCGKCLPCKKNRMSEWAIRIEDEISTHKDNCFITLTYNNESAPITCVKSDVVLFVKSMRNAGFKFKYFISAELGELNGRPHYHGIIMGWRPDDLIYYSKNKRGDIIYTSKILEDIWKKGYITVAEAEEGSIKYVLSYIMKQTNWSLKSNGIGKKYLVNNLNKIITDKYINTKRGKLSIPRYYIKKAREILGENLFITDGDILNIILSKQQETKKPFKKKLETENSHNERISSGWKTLNMLSKQDLTNQMLAKICSS